MDSHSLALIVNVGHLLGFVLYGFYSAAFAASIFYLIKKRHTYPKTITRLITLVDVFMFFLVTAQTALLSKIALSPFLDADPDASMAALSAVGPSDAAQIARLALLEVQLSVSSGLMIYRVWIFSRRRWYVVIPPACGCVGFMVCGSLFLKEAAIPQNIAQAPNELLPFGSALALQLAAFACDAVTNVYCSAFLSYNIWHIHRLIKDTGCDFQSISSLNIVAIIIESAALYTACIIALSVTFARQSISSYVITDMCAPITGISYCLVIIQFGMGGAFKASPQLPSSSLPSQGAGVQDTNHMATQPSTVVHVEQYTVSDTDGASSIFSRSAKAENTQPALA